MKNTCKMNKQNNDTEKGTYGMTENKTGSFTYSRKESQKIIKLFKEAQIETEFRTRNTVQNIVKPHPQIGMKKVAYTK
jgi:hypothetical protein